MSEGYDWQAIKDRHPIADVVRQSITLKKSGKEFVGLCPFHPDRKPSFQIIPHKQFAFCPSCGWNGDVIKFVSQYKSISLAEAVRELDGDSQIEESAEIKAARKRAIEVREQEDAEMRVKAIAAANQIWENADGADPDHPYLVKKDVDVHSLRQDGDELVLPIYDSDGEIQSIQTIKPDGFKKFHPGAPVSNGRMAIGMGWDKPSILCEGYATGATIREAIDMRVVITFSMGNMEKVARSMVDDGRRIILAADTGTSTEYMTALADELGCGLAIPETKKGTDFNDQAGEFGLDHVKAVFEKALKTYEKQCKVSDASPESAVYRGNNDGGYPFDISGINLTEPPGWTGKLTDWIESQNRRPRRIISTAAALTALGNIAGLRYIDARDGTTTNLFCFCVAGSRTGKEGVNQAVAQIHRVAGVAAATHGSIKSEQEIVKNLTRHQAAFYVVDEVGDLLAKIKNAQKRGGAIYLDGVIAMVMSAYSKADGYMLLTGDMKETVRKDLIGEMASFNKKLDDGEDGEFVKAKIAVLQKQLSEIDNGLEKPFLSMIGFTTPVAFDVLVDHQAATNGFIGRSLIFNERDTAPRSKVLKGFRKPEMEMTMQMRIKSIGGLDDGSIGRVENYGERIAIECDDDADDMLADALKWFEDQAIVQRETSDLESLYLGAYELLSKVSLILAIPDGVKTAEHVRWAFAMVVKDIQEKMLLVISNDREKDAPMLSMQAKIVNLCSSKDGETMGVLYNRLRGKKREDVDQAIDGLIENGALKRVESVHKFTRKKIVRIIASGHEKHA